MGQALLFFPFGILLQGWQPQLKTPLLRSGAAKSSKMTKERKTVRSLLAFFASASLSFLVIWSIEKLGAIAAEYSPFYGIEKGAVLQEARIFNDSHVDARRCQQVEPHSSLQMDSSAYDILSDEAMSSYEPSETPSWNGAGYHKATVPPVPRRDIHKGQLFSLRPIMIDNLT